MSNIGKKTKIWFSVKPSLFIVENPSERHTPFYWQRGAASRSSPSDLSACELDDILKGKQLSDRHINAANVLLKKQLLHVLGLQDTILGTPTHPTLPMHNGSIQFNRVRTNFIQIFHDRDKKFRNFHAGCTTVLLIFRLFGFFIFSTEFF